MCRLNSPADIGLSQKAGDHVMDANDRLIANELVVLREEFDDWAILYDPDSGSGFGINPVSVLIWKCLDGSHSKDDILAEVHKKFDDVPENASEHIDEFLDQLIKRSLAGQEVTDRHEADEHPQIG